GPHRGSGRRSRWRSIRRLGLAYRCRRLVQQGHQPGRIQIIELVVIDRPEKGDAGTDQEQDGQGDHDDEDAHAPTPTVACSASRLRIGWRPIRRALSTTNSELADMPIAASHGGTKPSAANGTAS